MVKHLTKHDTKNMLGRLVLAVAIAEPLSTIPQIIDLYSSKDAHGLSLLSWFLFFIGASIWLAYGVKIKNIPLIISSFLWVTTELILIVGILIYS